MPRRSAPDQIITHIPLIQRYSRHNEDEDWRFREFVKRKLNLSNPALDAVVTETTDAVWKQIDCTACAHCCKTLRIVVDDNDIRRLATRLGMSVRQFSKTHVRVDEDDEKYLANSPCSFLGEDNRCTVYEDRPQACRDFPYLHSPDFRSRSIMMVENVSVCPIVFNVWQRLNARHWKRIR